MKSKPGLLSTLALLLILPGFQFARSSGSEKALWVELRDSDDRKTTIAVTEGIARAVLEAKGTKVHFSKEGKKDLITREMLEAVLDGREESVTATDENDGSQAVISLRRLKVPGRQSGKDRLVLETYKAGTKSFRMALPDIEVEVSDQEGGGEEYVQTSLGWKALLPFLAKTGGAVYIKTDDDETEVWVYID